MICFTATSTFLPLIVYCEEMKQRLSFTLQLTPAVFKRIWQIYIYLTDIQASLTGMSFVSSSMAGTCRADKAFLMAPLIFVTSSEQKGFPGAIFRNKITLSSPSVLYWGTHRLSETSSKASTVKKESKEWEAKTKIKRPYERL